MTGSTPLPKKGVAIKHGVGGPLKERKLFCMVKLFSTQSNRAKALQQEQPHGSSI
jgi:hypothetical protein